MKMPMHLFKMLIEQKSPNLSVGAFEIYQEINYLLSSVPSPPSIFSFKLAKALMSPNVDFSTCELTAFTAFESTPSGFLARGAAFLLPQGFLAHLPSKYRCDSLKSYAGSY